MFDISVKARFPLQSLVLLEVPNKQGLDKPGLDKQGTGKICEEPNKRGALVHGGRCMF